MSIRSRPARKPLDPRTFRDPDVTVMGKRRPKVAFEALHALERNTGTLCTIT